MKIELRSSTEPDFYHTCVSHREGNWIVFTCPQCHRYERRLNFQTGEMNCTPADDPYIVHQGQFVATGLEKVEASTN